MKLQNFRAQSGKAVAHTGDTSETAVATIKIPGGAMGTNGHVHVKAQFSMTGSTNQKTIKVKLGSTAFYTNSTTTAGHIFADLDMVVRNADAIDAQIGSPLASGINSGFGTSAGVAGTEDTSQDLDLTITVKLASAGETITLKGYDVEVVYGTDAVPA